MSEKSAEQRSTEAVPAQNSEPLAPQTQNESDCSGGSAYASSRGESWWISSLLKAVLAVSVGFTLLATLGFAQRMGWIANSSCDHAATAGGGAAAQDYICSMCPQVRLKEPGSCWVCGMALVVATSGSGGGDDFSVEIDVAARRIANIQTVAAKLEVVDRSIRSIGSVSFDESRLATISAYVDGRIEKLFADYEGFRVAKRDSLVTLYSPELFTAQAEHLLSGKLQQGLADLDRSGSDPPDVTIQEASREKLRELGMTDRQVEELDRSRRAQTRLEITAPIGGTVVEKLVVEGQYVKTGDPLFRIADLSVVWLTLKLFPDDASHIRYAQRVEAEVQSLPGEVISGRVSFVDPVVDPKTRTVGVRVEIINADGRLRPGDYATATIKIFADSKGDVYDSELAGKWISPQHPQIVRDEPGTCPISKKALIPTNQLGYAKQLSARTKSTVVPRDAVLMNGSYSVVYVETKTGCFCIRPVTLGTVTAGLAVILKGINPGDIVATSGNFLIDSQMQMAGNPSLIDPARALARVSGSHKKKSKPEPLQLESIKPRLLAGTAAEGLDRLYDSYFAIQQSLASDTVPLSRDVGLLSSSVDQLQSTANLSQPVQELLGPIVEHARHLRGDDIESNREHFKPISHAVVRLGARVHGSKRAGPFIHFFCPMVEGGGGDWLQKEGPLVNPYFGSTMLHCGIKVHEFAVTPQGAGGEKQNAKMDERRIKQTAGKPAETGTK